MSEDTGPKYLDRLETMMMKVINGNGDRRRISARNHTKKNPTRHCPICLQMWRFEEVLATDLPREGVCGECQDKLDEGWIAIREDKSEARMMWIKPPEGFAEMMGTEQLHACYEVSESVMDAFVKKAENQQEKGESDGN
jgi:hypothetical protein